MPTTTKGSPATGFICIFGLFAVIVMLFPSCQAVTHGVGKAYKSVGMISDFHVDMGPAVRHYDATFVKAYENADTMEEVDAVSARVKAGMPTHIWPSLRVQMARYDANVRTDAVNRIKYRATR